MTWRLGPVDQRTGGGRPPSTGVLAVPRRSGKSRLLALLGLVAGALVLLSGPVPVASAADSCANAVFRTGLSADLPDCRAYELVSPADKNNVSLQYTRTTSGSSLGFPSADGEHFSFGTLPPIADPKTGLSSMDIADRTGGGWATQNFASGGCLDVVKAADSLDFSGLTADFSTMIFKAPATQNCAPGDDAGIDVYAAHRGGTLTWVSQSGAPKTANVARNFAGNSADGRHILFSTTEKLVLPLENGRITGSGLYDRTDGRLVPVGLQDDGSLINGCGATAASGQGAVSADGRVIFFTSGSSTTVAGCSPATDDGGQLYARIGAAKTVEISRSVAATPDPAGRQAPAFLAATMDGSKVFFRSGEALTDDAPSGGGLYEYDLSRVLSGAASTGTLRLVGAGPGYGNHGISFAGMSDDGSVVYFVSTAVIAPGATVGGYNLYVADHGAQPVFVATMTGYDATVSVSRNGSKAVFLAKAADGTTQVFRYALGKSGTPCVSCPASGAATGDAKLYGVLTVISGGRPAALGPLRFVTDDGRVFFNSPDRLARRDINDLYDVYEYVDGQQRLISSGTGVQDALLMGTGDDGRDVFFATNDSLVVKDFDKGDQDIYDARVGGGFPAPPAKPQPCVEACQPAAPAPVLAAPGSVAFAAPFVPPARPVVAPKVKAKKVSVKRPKTVRGKTKVRLSVKAPEAGRIRVSGSGLRRAKKTAKKAKTYRVTVKLSKRSKRILKRKHRVKVRATVRFTPKHGKRSRVRVHVTFKTKKHHGKGSRRSHDRRDRSDRKGGR